MLKENDLDKNTGTNVMNFEILVPINIGMGKFRVRKSEHGGRFETCPTEPFRQGFPRYYPVRP